MSEPSHGRRTWMVLAEDGRHVWLGRDSDPTAEELSEIGTKLDGIGQPGWLAVCGGDYWGRRDPDVLIVRRLTEKDGSTDKALELWKAARCAKRASAR